MTLEEFQTEQAEREAKQRESALGAETEDHDGEAPDAIAA